MEASTILGLAVGMLAGAVLVESVPAAKKMVKDTTNMVKQKATSMSNQTKSKSN